jgi:UDP:flavonoid glycosyltransferase YjiC (YdhE family)
MKIIVVTYGSRGDVQPAIALGSALEDAGHTVVLAGPPEHEAWARDHVCVYRPMGGNFQSNVQGFPDPHTLKAAFGFIRLMRQEVRVQFSQLPEIVRDGDLVLGTSVAFGAHSAAELAGLPYGFVVLCPQILPSNQHPPLFMKRHDLPGWINQAAWRISFRLDNLTIRGVINRERQWLGLPPVQNAWQHLLGERVLVASDPVLGVIPDDVPLSVRQVGHLTLQAKVGLSEEVERFLGAGPAPIYAGFGSMFSSKPERFLDLALQAARSVGRRLIAASGWSRRVQENVGEDCLIVDEVPHSLLFPRVAAVVHHGGSGTTAAAARAGVPQVIVPHIMDQYYWAHSVWERGLGPKPIQRNRLSARRLSEALEACLQDEKMRRRAEEVGSALRNEDGVAQAVKTIESGSFRGD